jgi:hypothetical protein
MYEINVTLNGTHFFATAERSIQDTATLGKVLAVIQTKFPQSEGFAITVTRWEKRGYFVDLPPIPVRDGV